MKSEKFCCFATEKLADAGQGFLRIYVQDYYLLNTKPSEK